VLKRCEYTAANYPDRTIAVSKALREHFRTVHDSCVTYIPNGTVLPHVRKQGRPQRMEVYDVVVLSEDVR
jgi:hypothetical protein